MKVKDAATWSLLSILVLLICFYSAQEYFVTPAITTNNSHVTSRFDAAEFEGSLADCSTQILQTEAELADFLAKYNPSRRQCEAGDFKVTDDSSDGSPLSGAGVWYIPTPNNTDRAHFYPRTCRFADRAFDSLKLLRDYDKILVTGDSNGWEYFKGLLSSMGSLNYTCKLVRREGTHGKQKELAYFKVPGVPSDKMKMGDRGCSNCVSKTFRCHNNDNSTLRLEFIGMIHFIDSTLSLGYDMSGQFEGRFLSADTFLEYLLRYYLPWRGWPDLWLFSSPVHHDSWSRSLDKFQADLAYFWALMDVYLPAETPKLVLIPDVRECPSMVPGDVHNVIRSHWNTTRNEKIFLMNRLTLRSLGPRSRLRDHVVMFADLSRVTCPVMCSWHRDGGHMRPFWYEKILGYITQLL